MKHLKLFFALFAMLALGVGNAWGETTTYVMYPDGGSTFNSEWNKTSRTAKQTYASKVVVQMMKVNSGVYGEITSKNSVTNINAISVKCTANNAQKLTLYYSTDNSNWTELSKTSISKNTSSYSDYDIDVTGIPTTAYIKFRAETNSIYLYSITISTSEVATPDPVDPEVSFSNSTYTVGQTLDLSTLWTSNSDGAVTYSIVEAGTTGAFINGKSFTATAAGTCTVKASQAVTSAYNAIEKTATITVTAPTPATITLSEAGQVKTVEGKYEGDSYELPLTSTQTCGTKTFVGWSTVEIATPGDKPTSKFYEPGTTVTLAAEQTFYAVYATEGEGGGTAFDGTSGGDFKIYALVEGEKKYLKGTGSKISPVGESEATEYTFTKISDGVFSIKTGTTYLTYASSTNLGTSTTSYSWNISKGTKGSWRIASVTSSGRGIVYRAAAYNQFGGYATNNIKADGTEYYDVEIGGGSSASYSDYTTSCGATPTIYNVTIADDIQNGTVKASSTSAAEGATITLTVTPDDGYMLNNLSVTDENSNSILVTDNTFEMPASNVTVSATFKQDESGEVESNSTATIVFASNANQEDGSSSVITAQTEIDKVVAQGVEFVSGFSDVSKVYPNSVHGLKLGTGSAIGKITIGLNISKKVSKITFKTYQYKEKEATIKFSAGGKEGSTSEFGDYTLTFDEPTTVSQIVISTEQVSKGRAYVSQIDIELAEDEAGEGSEDPVVPTPTFNPTATFVFNTADGLAKLGIAYPTTDDDASKKTDIENNTTVISNGVGLTMTGGTTTATRVWLTAGGVLDLRVYKGATLTFAVADGFEIIKVDFEGSDLTNLAVDNNPMTGTIWEGNQKSVTFENQSTVVKINTIAVTVAYTRDVTLDEYGTICIPYASSSYSGAKFYEVSWLKTDAGLYLDELAADAALEAGKPYIFFATSTEIKVTCTGDAVADPVEGENGLTGTFEDIADGDAALLGNYIIAQNQIWVAGANNSLPANRAYIDKDGVPTTEQPKLAGRRRVCMGENAATGLDNITNGENTTIKVIENGQLIIIRNGEKFNAQGQKL